jgi:polyhydroxyalkanoate synthesis regulator phasin
MLIIIKIQGTAVEDLRKQIKNLTEIVTKQEKPSASASASSQSEIDVLKAQVKTLTDLVLYWPLSTILLK